LSALSTNKTLSTTLLIDRTGELKFIERTGNYQRSQISIKNPADTWRIQRTQHNVSLRLMGLHFLMVKNPGYCPESTKRIRMASKM